LIDVFLALANVYCPNFYTDDLVCWTL